VLEWDPPHAQWFVGGRLNAAYNCLDRHLGGWRRNKAALIWEGEPGDTRTYTYWDLHREVSKFANVLKSLGVKKGDRVAIYLPMVPEAALRCWRARASARRIRWCSAASHRTACATASTMRRRRCWSRRTAATAAAAWWR
jgi:acyl-CoA synthetase (AMP-forming)/AMP-acid ligase II